MTTRKPSQRYFRALALEPRILLDAAAVNTAADVAAQVDATPEAPGVKATPQSSVITITDSTDSFAPVDLFKDVEVTLDSRDSDPLTQLVISVDRAGSNQALVIDGKTIELITGSGTTRADNDGYQYSVRVSGNTATITIELDSFDREPQDVANLIDSLSYQPLDKFVPSGSVTVTLQSLSDEFDERADLSAIKTTVEIDNQVNIPPVISGDLLKEAETLNTGVLAKSTEIAYSADGNYVYAVGSNNSISVFAVSETGNLTLKQTLENIPDLGDVSHLQVSSDGKSIYTASGGSTIVHLNVNAEGTLSYNSSIAVGSRVTGSLALTEDGKQLYVGSQHNGVYIYNRDSETGALSMLGQRIEGDSGLITTSGDYVYIAYAPSGVVTPPSVAVYQRNAAGTGVPAERDKIDVSSASSSLTTSQDGRYLYAGNGNGITIYHLGTDNTLTQANAINGIQVGSLSMNSNGDRLYAAATDGTIHIYGVAADGSLSVLGTTTSDTSGREVAISPDGRSVLISGDGLTRFTSIQTLVRGEQISIANNLTLSDANFDRLADNTGDYQGATLEISRAGGASANDVFALAAINGLSLEHDQIIKNGQPIATFTQSGGALTITFLAGSSRDDANAVLRQVTYGNTSSEANGSVVRLELHANDGEASSQVVSLDVLLTLNTAPVLNASGVSDLNYDTSATQANLFSNTSISVGETGQSIIQLKLDIGDLADVANEFLVVAGTSIDLSQSGSGNTGAYTYTYTRSGDSATLLINSSGMSTAAAQNLVNGIAYVNTTTEATTGTRTFTLAAIQDNGGTAGGGNDASEPGISASIALAINNAPQWQNDVSEPDPTLYYVDGTLNGYNEYVTDIVVSADGKTLVISGSTQANAGGTSYLRVYARDAATGELTLRQTFTQGASDNPDTTAIEANGLNGISSMVMHGNSLYVAGNSGDAGTYSLVRFTYDAGTGEYAYAGIVATQGVGGVTGLDAQISEIVISADGKSLYTINGVSTIDGRTEKSALAQFSIDPQSGSLTYLDAYQGGTTELGMNAPSGIVVSPDGKSVYVSNRSGSMLTVLARDTQSGVLSYVTRINHDSIAADPDSAAWPRGDDRYLLEMQDVVISPDGKHLYVGSGQQATLSIFSRDANDGSLTYAGTLDLYGQQLTPANALQIREMAVSQDGSALYVGMNGGALLVFARDSSTGALSFASSLNTGSRTTQIAVSADGQNIYTGRSQSTTGVAILSALPNSTYVASRPSTPFTDGIHFSDPDFDVENNYQGAQLTISRSGTPSANDLFGFKADAGLSLVGNQIVQNGTAIAEFVSADGTLSIRFTAEVNGTTANQVLQQITYRNDSAEPPARVDLKLTIGDGGKSTETTLALLRAPTTSDPTLTASGQQTSVTIGTGSLPSPVDLFRQVEVFLDDDGEPLTNLVITVDRSGNDQALIIDGEEIALQIGSGQTSTNGYPYEVEVNNGVTSIRISIDSSSNGATPQAAATLIDSIAYKVLADGAATGTVTITLASLSDSSNDQIEPGISASVIVRDQRQLPTLDSLDKSLAYVEVVQLLQNGNEFENDLKGVKDVTVIGDKIYALRADTLWNDETFENDPVNVLYVFQRTDSGSLELVDSKNITGISDVARMRVSSDGGVLYIIGADGIALFNAETGTQIGNLSFAAEGSSGEDNNDGGLGEDTVSPGLVNDVLAQGNFVYVSLAESVQVYSRSGGDLTLVQTLTDLDQIGGANALAISPAGDTLFVATSGGQGLVSVFRIETDGKLGFQQAVAGFGGGDDGFFYGSTLSLSPDGNSLYVIDNKSTLHTLTQSAGGTWSAIGMLDLSTIAPNVFGEISVKDIIISPDGHTVLVTGDFGFSADWATVGILAYTRGEDGSLTLQQAIDGFDSTQFSEVRHATFSADGSQLYLTGAFNNGRPEGILILEMKPAIATFTEGGGAVALLPGGTLGDPQLDARNNYEDARLTIERQGGAQPGDSYSLLDASGLELRDGQVWDGDTALANFVIDTNGRLTISFLAGVNQADAQRVLRSVAYDSSSNDPAQAGQNATFTVVFDDGDGNLADMRIEVILEGVNDPAVVSTSPLNPTFNAGGALVKLFENTQVDTVENGQGIWKVQVTISGAAEGDILGVGNEQISDFRAHIGQGMKTLASGQAYTVIDRGDTLTIEFFMPSASATPAYTQAFIDGLSYGSENESPSGSRTISLGVIEDDYATPSQFTEQTTVTLEPARPVSATEFPELTATGAQSQLEIDNNGLPAAVDLFSGVSVLADKDNQQLTALYITVNRNGADQALVIDGREITLQATTDVVVTRDNGYAYSVVINPDGSATVKIFIDSSSADKPADVERLVDGISYKVLANTVADGNVLVTLSGISDFDDASLNISASIDVSHSAAAQTPTITATGSDTEIRIGSGGALPGDVDLFSGVSVSAGLDGSEIERLLITVDRTGGNQALVIGGTQIALSAGDGVGDGYLYEVTVSGDTTTVALTFIGKSASEVGALIDGTAYRVLDSSVASGEVTVTLSEIRNSDNIEAEPGISAKVTLATNADPVANPGNFGLVDAKAGQNYSVQLPANLFSDANGDSLTWTIDGLPAGLSFDPVTRTLSGNLQAMGSHDLTIKVSDGWGGAAEIELTLDVVNSEPVANGQFSLGSVTPGQAYAVTLPDNLFSDANDSELSWEIVELPEWLSFDAATRTLSGTAPDVQGSHAITLTATDPHGATVSRTLTLAVALPPVQNTGDSVLPELSTGFQQAASAPAPASFGGPALNAPLFDSSEAPASDAAQAPAPLPPTTTAQSLLRSSTGSGLADGRGSLSEQLANADGVLTDSGLQSTASSFSFDGSTLRSTVDLNQNASSRSIELRLPVETADGASAQRVILANGLPLPSWASFDARSGELRIDRDRLQGDGVLRLTLISRDGEGKEQRTAVEVRAAQGPANVEREAPQAPTAQAESLPERLRQDTSSALLGEALELLDQLSDLAGEPVVITTRHTA